MKFYLGFFEQRPLAPPRLRSDWPHCRARALGTGGKKGLYNIILYCVVRASGEVREIIIKNNPDLYYNNYYYYYYIYVRTIFCTLTPTAAGARTIINIRVKYSRGRVPRARNVGFAGGWEGGSRLYFVYFFSLPFFFFFIVLNDKYRPTRVPENKNECEKKNWADIRFAVYTRPISIAYTASSQCIYYTFIFWRTIEYYTHTQSSIIQGAAHDCSTSCEL